MNKYLEFLYMFLGFRRTNNWKQRALVILCHALAWLIFFTFPLAFFRFRFNSNAFIIRELINKSVLIAFFYLHHYVLVPWLLKRKQVARYCGALLICFLLIGTQQFFAERYFFKAGRQFRIEGRINGPMERPHIQFHEGHPPGDTQRALDMIMPFLIFSFTFLVLLSGFIHLIVHVLKGRDERRSFENLKLKAEIEQMKSQINPHFLFNTLNTIYSQVYHQSPNAEKSVLKLSGILRYVIYESDTDKIALEKDLQYISDYIDLQRLRINANMVLDFNIHHESQGLMIAPLLLITFIENAFKHGMSYEEGSRIVVDIRVFGKTLTMWVSNPRKEANNFDFEGIGLRNARRRLDLIYPGLYSLEITPAADEYIVNLQIQLAP